MLSPEELEIAQYGKEQGKTRDEVLKALSKYRESKVSTPVVQPSEEPLSNKVAGALGFGKAVDTFGNLIARQTVPEEQKEFVPKPTAKETAGAILQTGATLIPGAAGANLTRQIIAGAGAGYLYDIGADLSENKSTAEVLTPGMGTALGAAVPPVLRGASNLLKSATQPLARGAQQVATRVAESAPAVQEATQGVTQIAKDVAERVPRFVARRKENLDEAAQKAENIRNAPPLVQEAYKVDLDERFITAVQNADEPTKQAYKRVIDIAEETPKNLGTKTQPTIVGGELASKQYDIIDSQRKKIGEAIGAEVDKLSQSNVKADMGVAFGQVDDVLADQGITLGKKNKLVFTGKYTPQERARIQELYDLSREAGNVLSAKQVRDMDVLFSKLQREARMEGVGDILIDVNGQKMSMFRVFRDIYANQLENIAPNIRPLNAQYRNLSTLIDDIEDSIFKTPNFNITKSTDDAEFAKVNLRRIFGEANSSPVYEAIADEMDAVSRQLGYADASPKEVAAFAQELRTLYPETIPKTGFSGGIRSGIMDLVSGVMEAGKISPEDKRKALRALIEGEKQSSLQQAPAALAGVGASSEETNTETDTALSALGLVGFLSKRKQTAEAKEAWKIIQGLSKRRAQLVQSKTSNPDKNKSITDTLKSIDESIRRYSRSL